MSGSGSCQGQGQGQLPPAFLEKALLIVFGAAQRTAGAPLGVALERRHARFVKDVAAGEDDLQRESASETSHLFGSRVSEFQILCLRRRRCFDCCVL